jgi:hypothetical protein
MRWKIPKHKDTRVCEKFLWFTMIIGDEARRWEFAQWLEVYNDPFDGLGRRWEKVKWLPVTNKDNLEHITEVLK